MKKIFPIILTLTLLSGFSAIAINNAVAAGETAANPDAIKAASRSALDALHKTPAGPSKTRKKVKIKKGAKVAKAAKAVESAPAPTAAAPAPAPVAAVPAPAPSVAAPAPAPIAEAPVATPAAATSGSISGTTIAYIAGGVVVVAALASHKGTTGTH